jgi:hypothetical protein
MTRRFGKTFASSQAVHVAPPSSGIDPLAAARFVKSKTGKGYWRQFLEIARARFGGNKISASDYYRFGLHRETLSAVDRAGFVGNEFRDELNRALCSNPLKQTALMHDKLLFSMVLRQNQIPTTNTQACLGRAGQIDGLTCLRSTDDIVGFVANDAKLPLFCKPNSRAFGIGTLSILSRSPDRRDVTLGNGQTVSLQKLAADIGGHFASGYLFQDHLVQHPIAVQVCGTAIGTLRVATVMLPDGPKLLYAHQRIPGAGAMSDSAHTRMRENAEIDVGTGLVTQHYFGDRTFGHAVPVARVSQTSFVGTQIPFWPEITEFLTRGHWLMPSNCCIGWDVALTIDGPVVIEAQGNPYHMHWQLASGRGLVNPEFARHFLAALHHSGYRKNGYVMRKLRAQARLSEV